MTMTRQDINNERSRQLQDITDKTSKKDQRMINKETSTMGHQRKIIERSKKDQRKINNKTSRQ